jgi:hypothetical protein
MKTSLKFPLPARNHNELALRVRKILQPVIKANNFSPRVGNLLIDAVTDAFNRADGMAGNSVFDTASVSNCAFTVQANALTGEVHIYKKIA